MLKTDTYPSVFVRCSQTDGFTHVYPSVIEVSPQIPKWPFGFLLYMFGFRGCIGFRGCSSKKRHRYRSKNRGHVIRPSVFISLIDYTPPLNATPNFLTFDTLINNGCHMRSVIWVINKSLINQTCEVKNIDQSKNKFHIHFCKVAWSTYKLHKGMYTKRLLT